MMCMTEITRGQSPCELYDRTVSKELGYDYIFDEYYRDHGFDNPF